MWLHVPLLVTLFPWECIIVVRRRGILGKQALCGRRFDKIRCNLFYDSMAYLPLSDSN